MPDPRKVFVVHGRSTRARDAMFAFLHALGLEPVDWHQAMNSLGRGSPFVWDILDAGLSTSQAIVVLLTGDDRGRLRKRFRRPGDPPHERRYTRQPRLNVVFEAGLALGRYPDRTILVQLGTHALRPFSDLEGRFVLKISGTQQDRIQLRRQLEVAGCDTSNATPDYLTAGDFGRPIRGSTFPA